ncbi:MAG TPA: hypothetical protein VF715_14025 [Thermoleophilaceae bacterium]|jgi:hypothetical protein
MGLAVRTILLAFVCGLVSLVVCVSIPPLTDWTQETAACPGADRVERDVRDGGDVQTRGPGNSTSTVGTTVFELRCTSGDSVELVGNDEAVLQGFALSFLLGAVPCAALVLGRALVRRGRDRTAPA